MEEADDFAVGAEQEQDSSGPGTSGQSTSLTRPLVMEGDVTDSQLVAADGKTEQQTVMGNSEKEDMVKAAPRTWAEITKSSDNQGKVSGGNGAKEADPSSYHLVTFTKNEIQDHMMFLLQGKVLLTFLMTR